METYLKDQADFSRINRVLVIKLQHLGDVLLTTPIFSTLKQQHPQLEIDALVYSDTASLLTNNPEVKNIFCVDRTWKSQGFQKISHELTLFNALKNRQYELIICLTDRMRAAWLARTLQPIYSVAQKYPHKRGKFWRNSFSHLYSVPTQPRHTVEINLDALRRIGVYPNQNTTQLSIYASIEAKQNTQILLENHKLTPNQYVVIHPTSRWMFKAWNTSGVSTLLELLDRHNIKTVLVSGPDPKELAYAKKIIAQQSSCIDLSGQLTLPELSQLIANASCFVGLDSVAMHIAAAVNTPTVALFGPSNNNIWHPWQVSHRILTSNFTCRPCGQDGCGNGKISDCLQHITPQQVFDAVIELIQDKH